MKLLGISGTVTGSKTLLVVNQVLAEVKKLAPEIETECLNLKEYDVQFCDGRDPAAYNDDTRAVIEKVTAADFYVIGTPIFQSSFTGALKNLIDLIPPTVFSRKVVGFVATGGSDQHFLVVESQLKPIFGYFGSYQAPQFVYVKNEHVRDSIIVDSEINQQIRSLAQELVKMQQSLKA